MINFPTTLLSMVTSLSGQSETHLLTNHLYLSAIVYCNPKQWTIWVNGQSIDHDMQTCDYKISSITNEFVVFNIKEKQYKLFANQTLDIKSGKTLCGDKRPESVNDLSALDVPDF
jgi:hypothetical protein